MTLQFPRARMDVYRPNQRFEPLRASMAVPDPELLRAIHQISEAIGSYERSKILYLCEISDTGNTAAHIKETLKSKVKSYDKGRLFLAELMLHLGRYDILRQVFGFSRDDVERALRSEQVLPRFRVLIAHISEDMAKDDVSSVKFLLAHMLPRKKMETAKDFLDLVVELEHVGKVSPTRVDLLEECLMDVGRVDLAKKLKVYKMSVNVPAVPEEVMRHPCQESPVSRYTFTSDPRGECVIIDCLGNDGEMMAQAFKSLHFNVTLHKWLNLVETVSTLKGLPKESGPQWRWLRLLHHQPGDRQSPPGHGHELRRPPSGRCPPLFQRRRLSGAGRQAKTVSHPELHCQTSNPALWRTAGMTAGRRTVAPVS